MIEGSGHDRHICVINNRPYFRTWWGGGYYGNFPANVDVFDGQFHQWDLIVKTGEGQKAYIDGSLVATHTHDRSNFDWKFNLWIGRSYDCGNTFVGSFKDVKYINLGAAGETD